VREWEVKNSALYRAGVVNEAELGARNLQKALSESASFSEIASEVVKMLRTPEGLADLTKMVANPRFLEQAGKVMEKKASTASLANVLLAMTAPSASRPAAATRTSSIHMETLDDLKSMAAKQKAWIPSYWVHISTFLEVGQTRSRPRAGRPPCLSAISRFWIFV